MPSLYSPDYQPHYRQSWALVIGINRYQYDHPLEYACNDADAVAEVLRAELGFPPDHVTVLKDEAATKRAILYQLYSFEHRDKNPDDRLLIFYAGHGIMRRGHHGEVGYLVPVDGVPNNLNTLIRWGALTEAAEHFPAKHVLFIMDACYSGLAMRRGGAPGSERFLSEMLQRLSRQVIAAGKGDQQVADEGGGPDGKNSIFTGHLLDGMRGAAADENGVLTASGLLHYVYRKVSSDSRAEQDPHGGHIAGDGDFILRTSNPQQILASPEADVLVLAVAEHPDVTPDLYQSPSKPDFIRENGYSNPAHPSFGRNDWSDQLGEVRYGDQGDLEITRAYSWLSCILVPTDTKALDLDIEALRKAPHAFLPHPTKPYEHIQLPFYVETQLDTLTYYDPVYSETKQWGRYLRIDEKGNIEYASSHRNLVYYRNDERQFSYVQLIGDVWQFMVVGKHLLASEGYNGGAHLYVNLVGTRNSVLTDYAAHPNPSTGGQWLSRGQRNLYRDMNWDREVCRSPNIQLDYRLVLRTLNDNQVFSVVRRVADKLKLAYNHQETTPRCFIRDTETFPWGQYRSSRG